MGVIVFSVVWAIVHTMQQACWFMFVQVYTYQVCTLHFRLFVNVPIFVYSVNPGSYALDRVRRLQFVFNPRLCQH